MSQPKNSDAPSALSLAWLFGNIAFAAISRAITYPFHTIRASSFRKDVLYTGIRTLLCHVTVPQTRYLNASTTQRYLEFCRSRKRMANNIEVQKKGVNTVAHWIGDPRADAVILYIHGGAFFQPATEGVFVYHDHLIRELNAANKHRSVAVVIVAYSLAPESTHPTQVREAATILSHLIESIGRSPSDIFLSGDSAGGTIALGLLSHLLHPHAQIDPIKLDAPLAGVLLYSPCVGFSAGYPSFSENGNRDMLPPAKLGAWAGMFLGMPSDPSVDGASIAGDAYSEPASNASTWWQGLHQVIGQVMVLSGSYEVFADPIRKFGQDLEEGWSEGGGDPRAITFIETPCEAHIEPIVDFMIVGEQAAKTASQQVVYEWYSARLEK